MLFDMLDLSKKGTEIKDAYWLRRNAVIDGVPADCMYAYRKLLNSCIGHFKGLIDRVIQSDGGHVEAPMQPEVFERYFTGFTFEHSPITSFPSGKGDIDGWWMLEGERLNHVHIFYNDRKPVVRQRYTIIHELFHFAQTADLAFLDFIDELIENTTLPPSVVVKILERSTEKAAAMYLMPNDFFVKKYHEITNEEPQLNTQEIIRRLAKTFEVSIPSTSYRLQECHIFNASLGRNYM